MINIKHGDLLKSGEPIIAHGCNALGIMGGGIALQIRNKYPECFKEYKRHYDRYGLFLDQVIFYQKPDGFLIGNCITQQDIGTYKRQVDYEAVGACMVTVLDKALELGYKSIGVNMIGCGLAGGSWEYVYKILNDVSWYYPEVKINVYIFDETEYKEALNVASRIGSV